MLQKEYLKAVTVHEIFNVDMPTGDQEYNLRIPDGTKKIEFQLRDRSTLQYTFVSGESGTKYKTVKEGTTKSEDNVHLNNKTLYFRSPDSNMTLEVEVWK